MGCLTSISPATATKDEFESYCSTMAAEQGCFVASAIDFLDGSFRFNLVGGGSGP